MRSLFLLILLLLSFMLYITTFVDDIYNAGKNQIGTITNLGLMSGKNHKAVKANGFVVGQESESGDACSGFLWRYELDRALLCTLSKKEVEKVENFATMLKGRTPLDTVWKVSEFIDSLEYDWVKANMSNPEIVFWSDGRVEVTEGKENIFQTPMETIERGKGVCRDFAILALSILVNQYKGELYYLHIDFRDSGLKHAAAAIKIDGEFFVMDQHIPPLDVGSYFEKWKSLDSKVIERITVYPVKVNGTVEVGNKYIITDFEHHDYEICKDDLLKIQKSISEKLKEYGLKEDERLKKITSSYVPSGYVKGHLWKFTFAGYADFYNPVFHEQYIGYFFSKMTESEDFIKSVENSKGLWVEVEESADEIISMKNLEITVYLGS
jgi:hypothetical protein